MQSLSVLIPAYNNALSHCQYIVRTENTGRAVIRNFLAQTAQYEFLLLIDSDMSVVSESFIQNYLAADCQTVVDGGIIVCGNPDELQGNLRYLYEQAEAPRHTAAERQRSPHQHIHTANLLIRRDLLLQYPFDERFRHYGYEDVLLGKTLHQHHVPILHIDNPLGMGTFETNAAFVAKTEEGLRTLHTFRNELRGYSRLLTFDFPRVKESHKKYACQLLTQYVKKQDGKQMVLTPADGKYPEQYGFNIFELPVDKKSMKLTFSGKEGENVGFRYGVVLVNDNMEPTYLPFYKDIKKSFHVKKAKDTTRAFFVVVGCPTNNYERMSWGRRNQNQDKQTTYEYTLTVK